MNAGKKPRAKAVLPATAPSTASTIKTLRALDALAKKAAAVAEAANAVAVTRFPAPAKKPRKKATASSGDGPLQALPEMIAKHVSMDAEAKEMALRLADLLTTAKRGDPSVRSEAGEDGKVKITLTVPGDDRLASLFADSSVARMALGKFLSKKLKGFKFENASRTYDGLRVQFVLTGKA